MCGMFHDKAESEHDGRMSIAIGVSRPTLSRPFQDPASVRDSAVKKILRGLGDLGCVPNFFATLLNRKSTSLVGVIIPHLNDLFFPSLMEVIQQAAMVKGFTVIAQSSHGDAVLEQHAEGRLMSMNVDGMIVAPLGEGSSARTFERLRAAMPLVFVDAHLRDALSGIPFVGPDNRQSIALFLDYLCRSGDAPLFLGMPRLNSNATDREAAYLVEMEKRAFRPRSYPVSRLRDGSSRPMPLASWMIIPPKASSKPAPCSAPMTALPSGRYGPQTGIGCSARMAGCASPGTTTIRSAGS